MKTFIIAIISCALGMVLFYILALKKQMKFLQRKKKDKPNVEVPDNLNDIIDTINKPDK
jgi:hypothetical protein